MDFNSISYSVAFGGVGALVLVCGILAGVIERRQRSRRNLDRISTVPWGFVSALCSMLAIMTFATAAKFYFTGS